jgi:hypothetical protein
MSRETSKLVENFKELLVVDGVSGVPTFSEHSQKNLSVGYPTECLAISIATNRLNGAIIKC